MSSLVSSLGIKKQIKKATERIIVDAPSGIFEPINPEYAALKLKLKEEAKALGERNLPRTEQSTRSGTAEMSVDNEIQRVVNSYHEAAIAKIQHLEEVIDRETKEAKQKLSEIPLLPDRFNQTINSYLNNNATNFNKAKKEFNLVKQEYESFREANHLKRTCNIRSGMHKCLSWLFAILVIFFEVVLNFSFFAENLEGGAIAGAKYAFFCSAFNILISALIGYWIIRNINHVRPIRKAFGWFGVLLVILSISVIGFGVGHIRDAMQIPLDELERTGETVASIALGSFKENPFNLTDIYSWILVGLTIVFGIGGCIDGYLYDDAYPGYSKIANKFNIASADWAGELEVRRNEINDIQDEFVNLITEQVHACDNGLECINKSRLDKEQTLAAYEAAKRSADKAFQTLVSLFRSENTKYRTDPAPKYFEEPIVLDLEQLPVVVSAPDDTAEYENLKNEILKLHNETQNIRSEIIKAFNEQEAKIQLEKEQMNV